MKYNQSKPNPLIGDTMTPKERLRSSARTAALKAKQSSPKAMIKAAHKRVKADGVDFNRV